MIVEYLGAGTETLAELANGKHPFHKVLKAGQERPMLILGQAALTGSGGAGVAVTCREDCRNNGHARQGRRNGFNVLHTAASRVGGLDLGFVPGEGRL